MAPTLVSNDDATYNAKSISERLSKGDPAVIDIPAYFIPPADKRIEVPHDAWADVPVLDLAEAETDEAGLAKKLLKAFEEWGFFTFINHGIPLDLMDEVWTQGHKFFDLPLEVKQKVARKDTLYGYVKDSWKLVDSSTLPLSWNEVLVLDLTQQQAKTIEEKLSPSLDDQFSSTVERYVAHIKEVEIRILELLAVGLGGPRNTFSRHIAPGSDYRHMLRWNFYPTCPRPLDVYGLGGHTDPDVLTILHDGGVGGLQVYQNGEWKGVKPVKGALICNSGDVLHPWTNSKVKSALHRVAVNDRTPRLSTGTFVTIGDEVVVSAPSSMVEDKGEERLYRDFLMADQRRGVSEANKIRPTKTLDYLIDTYSLKNQAAV